MSAHRGGTSWIPVGLALFTVAWGGNQAALLLALGVIALGCLGVLVPGRHAPDPEVVAAP